MENQATAPAERLKRLIALHRQDPDNVLLIGDLVNAYLAVGDVGAADRFISSEMARLPGDSRLQNWAVIAALAGQDYRRAEELAARLMAAGEDAPAIRYNRAFALLLLKQADSAISLLAPMLPRWRECPPLALLLARAYLLTQRFTEAKDALHILLAERPDDPEALGVLALCQLDSGDPAGATETARRSLARDRTQLEALIVAGSVELAGHRLSAAQTLLRPAATLHPTSGRLWSLLGQAEFAGLDFAAAEEALRHATTWMPAHIGTWHLLAWTQICTDRLVEARQSLDRAMELDHSFGETHGGLAVIAALEGRTADAEASAKRARRLNPEGFAGAFAETLLLERRGRAEEARDIIKALLDRDSPVAGRTFRQLVAESVTRHHATQDRPATREGGPK